MEMMKLMHPLWLQRARAWVWVPGYTGGSNSEVVVFSLEPAVVAVTNIIPPPTHLCHAEHQNP